MTNDHVCFVTKQPDGRNMCSCGREIRVSNIQIRPVKADEIEQLISELKTTRAQRIRKQSDS